MFTFFSLPHIVLLSMVLTAVVLCFIAGRHVLHACRRDFLPRLAPFETEDSAPTHNSYAQHSRSQLHQKFLDGDDIDPDLSASFTTSSPSTSASSARSAPPQPTFPDPVCPKCQSKQVDVDNRARKTSGLIGTMAGSTSAMAYTLSGAEAGIVVGRLAGPPGMMLGGLAGAIIAGFVGGAIGCKAGATMGEVIDANLLNNYRCLSCGHHFSKKPSIA